MGGLNGQKIHEASYTNVNEFEEVRSITLVPSKSLSFVTDQLKGVSAGLRMDIHHVVFYTQTIHKVFCLFLNSDINLTSIEVE